jgi:PAS domain S-box-containing protein
MPSAMQQAIESVAASPLAMVITNPRRADNPIELANPAFCWLTGYSETEVVGRNCRFLAGDRPEPWISSQIGQALLEQRSVLVDILNFRSDGTPFRNGVMIAPMFDDGGQLAYFLGSQVDLGSTDVTALSIRQARARSLVSALPPRQREVLGAMAKGLLNKQIGFAHGIAEKTVKMHRALLLERLGVATSADAIRIAVEAGL